jgi:phosphomannomutase
METLQKQGATSVAGFEANGGFLLGSHIPQAPALQPLPTRDAVLPVVTLLAQVKVQGKPLSQLVAALPQRYTASDRLQNFPTEKSKALLSGWTNNPADMLKSLKLGEQVLQIDTTDGLRATLQSGSVVHLRPSGNAPEFRCYVEETSQLAAQSLLASVMGQLKQFA